MKEELGILGLNYVSLYYKSEAEAVDFYKRVLGEPDVVNENPKITGWKLGGTWLTLFPATAGTDSDRDPCNAEFAILVESDQHVDALHAKFVAAGAKDCWKPEDTEMYEKMRFAAVDDPFGVRIDIYCPH